MSFLQRNHRLIFYTAWIVLGLLQSALTSLLDDEAYYWVYSHYLDWGYYDHPPLIAVLVKAGYAIFPNELGVRLFPLILNVLTLLIIEKLLNKKNPWLFYAIALSIAFLQLAGFIAVPDTPLIFCTALFFLCYQKFTQRPDWVNIVLLGIPMALLLYSKYHAVLVILFTLLSDMRLFRKYQLWVAGFIALLCFGPHLWWQYQHDWVSFKYHLFENNVTKYKVSYTTGYVLGQLLMAGPIAGIILVPAALLYRSENKTEKALRYTLVGMYVFFLLSSFRGRVEPNWTSPLMVPLFVLSHQYLAEKTRWQTLLYKLLPVTLILVLFARIVMIKDILPVTAIQQRFHHWKDWPAEMKERTRGLPVVFSNSYQRASQYWFNTGQMAYSQNLYRGRRNNFNFWPVEDSLLGKPVYYVDNFGMNRFPDSLKTSFGWLGYRYDSAFLSLAKINIDPAEKKIFLKEDDSITITATTSMPAHYHDFISRRPGQAVKLVVAFFDKQGWLKDDEKPISLGQLLQNPFQFAVRPGLPKGKYDMQLGLAVSDYFPTQNSAKIRLVVE